MAEQDLVYGRHPVAQMLSAQPEAIAKLWLQQGPASQTPRMLTFAEQAAALGVPVAYISRHALEQLTGAQTHQGVAVNVRAFGYVSVEEMVAQAQAPALVVVLDGVQDPHNLGALIRSALALGAHGVVIAKDRACEVTPTVVKASAGATAHLPVARVVNLSRTLAWLKDQGMWVVGTSPNATTPLAKIDMRTPTVIVVGSEGDGMRHGITKACDHVAYIPMSQTAGSLNAAVAGSICLYEVARQRQAG